MPDASASTISSCTHHLSPPEAAPAARGRVAKGPPSRPFRSAAGAATRNARPLRAPPKTTSTARRPSCRNVPSARRCSGCGSPGSPRPFWRERSGRAWRRRRFGHQHRERRGDSARYSPPAEGRQRHDGAEHPGLLTVATMRASPVRQGGARWSGKGIERRDRVVGAGVKNSCSLSSRRTSEEA